MNYTLKSPAHQHAATDDLCDNAQYVVTYTADYGERMGLTNRKAVTACDADDAERMARRQCKRDGGQNIRDISARYVGRSK